MQKQEERKAEAECGDAEMREIEDVFKKQNDPNFYDTILRQLKQSVVIVGQGELGEFPQVTAMYGAPTFLNNKGVVTRNIFEV